jgi:hypothetical protein
MDEERLRQLGVGDDPVTNTVFVLHRKDLETKGLLDTNKEVVLKKGDRIDSIERFGSAVGMKVKVFKDPGLYVWQVRSGSWGFGPDGYDLELLITSNRAQGAPA